MRSRLELAALAVTAIIVFGVPLWFVARRSLRRRRRRLQHQRSFQAIIMGQR